MSSFLLYGATGYVGEAMAREAVARGLRPILAGRDESRLRALADELGSSHAAFRLSDRSGMDRALEGVPLVLNCAGPFAHTYQPMVDGCLRAGVHYLDLTGEIDVYEGIARRGEDAATRGVMLLPGVGFDVVATDCLALHLKNRLPSAARLELAFQPRGPAGAPPGTQRTAIETIPRGTMVRQAGVVRPAPRGTGRRTADFGRGPVPLTTVTWGDVFTAHHSTGIPDIRTYIALPPGVGRVFSIAERLRPILATGVVRAVLNRLVRAGAGPEDLARSATHVWGRVEDDQGRSATARLHGPEAGVVWTVEAALAVVDRVLRGEAPPGYRTPAMAYGADLVLECRGVTREDVD